jgi:hypothetical protein
MAESRQGSVTLSVCIIASFTCALGLVSGTKVAFAFQDANKDPAQAQQLIDAAGVSGGITNQPPMVELTQTREHELTDEIVRHGHSCLPSDFAASQ